MTLYSFEYCSRPSDLKFVKLVNLSIVHAHAMLLIGVEFYTLLHVYMFHILI